MISLNKFYYPTIEWNCILGYDTLKLHVLKILKTHEVFQKTFPQSYKNILH